MQTREQLLRQIARAEEQLERLENLPDFSDLDNGAVICFKKRFPTTPNRLYTYAAIKHAGTWYLTSNRVVPSGFNDSALAEWIADGWPAAQPFDIWYATEWEEVL